MKKMIKMSLVAAVAVAGLTSTSSAADFKISGDAAIKYEMHNSAADVKTDFVDTEVNLDFTAKNEDGVSLHVGAKVYEGDQGENTSRSTEGADFKTTYAYIKTALPMGEKTVLKAGLVPNGPFGNGPILGGVAFESGGETFKTNIDTMAGDFKVTVGHATYHEAKNDTNKEDDDKTKVYAKVQNNAGDIKYGVQYSKTTDATGATETTSTALNPFVNGEASGIGFAAEYKSNGGDAEGKGMFVEAAKSMGQLTVGLAYLNMTDGMSAGADFDLDILDGDNNKAKGNDTSWVILPVVYKINDKMSAKFVMATGTLSNSDVAADEDKTTETDVALSYSLGKVTTVTAAYAMVKSDATSLDGSTQASVKIATKF